MELILKYIGKAMIKLTEIGQSIHGWAMMLGAFFLAYIGEGLASFAVVLAVVALDAIFGIVASIRRGGFILSYLARESLVKVLIYGVVLFVFYMIEHTLPIATLIATPVMATIIAVIELWSILAHVSILKPDLAIIKVLRLALRGEIARKLGVDPSEVTEALSTECEKE